MFTLEDAFTNFVCPDCLNNGDQIILKSAGLHARICNKCGRRFYVKGRFIDLLPAKASKLSNTVRSIYRDYYSKQFKVGSSVKYESPEAWGSPSYWSAGLKVFLIEEALLIKKEYSKSKETFCDISGSQGYFAIQASKYYKWVYVCDINLEYLQNLMKIARNRKIKNLIFVRSDYLSFPFKRRSLDMCLCTDSLIYYGLDSELNVIKQVLNKLKKGGRFVFDLHFKKFYAPTDKIHEYTRKELAILKETFKSIRLIPLGRVPVRLHPTRKFYKIFSRLLFLPPLRYLCVLNGT